MKKELQTLYWLTEEEAAEYIHTTKKRIAALLAEGEFRKGANGMYYRPSLDRFLLLNKAEEL